jgi:ubiquinone/menaquinone biosynthesis C-methylase UbiE
MLKATQRFSGRVDNYIKYRPSYPQQLLNILIDDCGLTRESIIADVGSGTGILTKFFLENKNTVFAVEPNKEMRQAAEQLLHTFPDFKSINGTAESTTLKSNSIDFITAGQAFHWFKRDNAKAEFIRILRPSGWVVLIWNERLSEGSEFLSAYENLLRKYAPEYGQVNHKNVSAKEIETFFKPMSCKEMHLPNFQKFDYTGLEGRLLSSSYAPTAGMPEHTNMITALKEIFERCNQNGQVVFEYTARIYYGRLKV